MTDKSRRLSRMIMVASTNVGKDVQSISSSLVLVLCWDYVGCSGTDRAIEVLK